jgi:hypothetical protein
LKGESSLPSSRNNRHEKAFLWRHTTLEEGMANAFQMTQEELDANETISLIAADKVEGTPVYNAEDEKLGTVAKLMIDKRSGKVSYAVMSFGGFLGMGESYHPLPWESLTYDVEKDGYVVTLTREQLEGGPRYQRNNEPDWRDGAVGRRIDDCYGVPLYGAVDVNSKR